MGKLRARFMLLLALGAAGGCEISGSCSKVAEIPSFDNVQAKADVDWISIMSNYKAVINGPSPIQIDVALYSHDAKESQVQDPSCAANSGDTIRTGHYSFYLRSKDNSVIRDQSIDSFGNSLLEFNDQRKMIQVLSNHGDWSSDLLAVQQYASCNGSEFAVLGLTEQGTGLLPYKFLINNKESNTLFASELTPVKLGDQNRLKSVVYDNSKGQWTTRYWFVDSNHGILSAGDYSPDFFPANGPKDAASDAQLIFEAYLKYRTDPGIDGERRIKDYKIHRIQMERENQSGEFVFSAVYDILPASDQYVLAGNGVMDKDGWVRGKMHFVSVLRNTGSYTIMSMGTSP